MAQIASKTYIEAIGRRKCAVARLRLTEATKTGWRVNDKPLETYFATEELCRTAQAPFDIIHGKKVAISVHVRGGGTHAQAEAISLALARALERLEGDLRAPLKKAKLLARNPREKERRKFGLKKARKSPKWSKR